MALRALLLTTLLATVLAAAVAPASASVDPPPTCRDGDVAVTIRLGHYERCISVLPGPAFEAGA